jgi:hypothetical protein
MELFTFIIIVVGLSFWICFSIAEVSVFVTSAVSFPRTSSTSRQNRVADGSGQCHATVSVSGAAEDVNVVAVRAPATQQNVISFRWVRWIRNPLNEDNFLRSTIILSFY